MSSIAHEKMPGQPAGLYLLIWNGTKNRKSLTRSHKSPQAMIDRQRLTNPAAGVVFDVGLMIGLVLAILAIVFGLI